MREGRGMRRGEREIESDKEEWINGEWEREEEGEEE